MTYRRQLRAEIDRLRALAADSTCHEDTRRQLQELIVETEQHLRDYEQGPTAALKGRDAAVK